MLPFLPPIHHCLLVHRSWEPAIKRSCCGWWLPSTCRSSMAARAQRHSREYMLPATSSGACWVECLEVEGCCGPPGLGLHVCLSESRLASPCGPVFACSAGPGPWQDPEVLAQLEQQRQQRIADTGRPAGMTVPEQLQAARGAGIGSSGQVEAAEDATPQAPEPATLAAATT